MNLLEAIQALARYPERSVVVAKRPFAWGSPARIVELDGDAKVPSTERDAGYEYVLEREEVLRLSAFASTKRMSDRAKAEFIAHYAQLDAFPAWFDDIPNL